MRGAAAPGGVFGGPLPMPFGAEYRPASGAVDFRLWAPDARRVDLQLRRPGEAEAASLTLSGDGSGWYRRTCADVPPGSRYRFRVDVAGAEPLAVPDPASRFNPDGVHGDSVVVDPAAFDWQDRDWRGRPWAEAVIYELHVGTFSPSGDYRGVVERLDYLVDLGVTAIELMPLAAAPGRRGWGYDGVLPYAPHAAYGSPDDLRTLVQSAHRKGLMMLLDVVYNHFGPEGNYLHLYASPFFDKAVHTPWGAALNLAPIAGDGSGGHDGGHDGGHGGGHDGGHGGDATAREFFIRNALYWLREYRFDGLRLDAVHAIPRGGVEPGGLLRELAARVADESDAQGRPLYLVLENDDNDARLLGATAPDGGSRGHYTAQWNDDAHHVLHVLVSGERDGYYRDYADRPLERLGRCLSEGFAFQGEPSAHRGDRPRGLPSDHLSPLAFVNFLQNHDQIGNRAFGERLHRIDGVAEARLRVAQALLLLAPSPPLLFMGEEFAADTPFLYFCDFGPELARAVTAGRRQEFAGFGGFDDPAMQARIPDPGAPATFERSRLDWDALDGPAARRTLACYRRLLQLRRRHVLPLLAGPVPTPAAAYRVSESAEGERCLRVDWRFGDRQTLCLAVSFSGAGALAGPGGAAGAAASGDDDAHGEVSGDGNNVKVNGDVGLVTIYRYPTGDVHGEPVAASIRWWLERPAAGPRGAGRP